MVAGGTVVGVTTNPTMFSKSISAGAGYADQLRELPPKGHATPAWRHRFNRWPEMINKAASVAKENSRHVIETVQRLSHHLRAAENRVAELEAEASAYQEQAERAEQWLHRVYSKIEERVLPQCASERIAANIGLFRLEPPDRRAFRGRRPHSTDWRPHYARCEPSERVDVACCSLASRVRRCRRQTISIPEYVALAQKMHSASISIVRASDWPVDKAAVVLDAEGAQTLAEGELNETMYQVQRIGDFAEPDQRSGIDDPGESARIA